MLLTVVDEKLWSESPRNSQSCNFIVTDPQCRFKIYQKWIEIPRIIWKKEPSEFVSGMFTARGDEELIQTVREGKRFGQLKAA